MAAISCVVTKASVCHGTILFAVYLNKANQMSIRY